ncbi:uncharacterized protein LOC142803424 [Rhipicephalus microplus]|uniref:uncharacterized protein LOC142803424 n=1 Tax=Rhipicephalus microplus TaxID=6941 RepID=UPI003F6AA283
MKCFFFVSMLMLLQLLWNYSDGYVVGNETGTYSFCLACINEKHRHPADIPRTKREEARAQFLTACASCLLPTFNHLEFMTTASGTTNTKQRNTTLTGTEDPRSEPAALWSPTDKDGWNRLEGIYKFINCTDDRQCPKNCTCMKYSQNRSYCAKIEDKYYNLDYQYII